MDPCDSGFITEPTPKSGGAAHSLKSRWQLLRSAPWLRGQRNPIRRDVSGGAGLVIKTRFESPPSGVKPDLFGRPPPGDRVFFGQQLT